MSAYLGSLLAWATAHPLPTSVMLVAGTLLLVIATHGLSRTLNVGRYRWQQRLRNWLGVAAGKRIGELSWLVVTVHLLAWPLLAYLLLHAWGLHDEGEHLARALYSHGVVIGGVRVVLGKLLIGIVLFAVLYTATRWLKRKLEFQWLVSANVEPSTRDAVATVFGQVTFVIAAVIGLSYAGLDLSKLAIVAGALSVGIGFGLQNIVNNFVSGLILLFERPVRTGDYIYVGATEGIVRKMRIRATEIETGDRDTVIVPNSVLLSSHLRNRNLRSRQGRVTLTIGVAYDSDPRRVCELLLEIANAHPGVIRAGQIAGLPGPGVSLTSFGSSTLDFELQAQILSADAKGGIASDLRFSILETFRREGIELPFPQQDVRLRGTVATSGGVQDASMHGTAISLD